MAGVDYAAVQPNKKAGARPAFSNLGTQVTRRSVPAELVVDASGDDINVLTDAALGHLHASRDDRAVAHEAIGLVLHEHVIVFDAGRPVRGEAIFRPTPTTPPQRVSSTLLATGAPLAVVSIR